jgi:hypothetical protein
VTQSRRAFLTSLSAAAYGLASDKAVPSEAFRYPDPATEFPVLRITDPKNTSWLPAFYSRAVSRKGSFLLYSNDRSGSFQLYRMDLKSGQSRELTEVKDSGHRVAGATAGREKLLLRRGRKRRAGESERRTSASGLLHRGGI